MKLAVVGTRTFTDYDALAAVLDTNYPHATAIVSGGAQGTDALAARYATERGLELIEHRADWDTHGRAAGPMRNKLIARDCDAMVAFWDGASRGTMNAMRCAKNANKQVVVLPVN